MFSAKNLAKLADMATEKAEMKAAWEYPPGAEREARSRELAAQYYSEYITPPDGRCPHCNKPLNGGR